jgi:hypothetical protein
MSGDTASFIGNIPGHYDNGLRPVVFVDYAADIARRAAACNPTRVLETAAGTGIVTRQLRDFLPATLRKKSPISPQVPLLLIDFDRSERIPKSIGESLRRLHVFPNSCACKRCGRPWHRRALRSVALSFSAKLVLLDCQILTAQTGGGHRRAPRRRRRSASSAYQAARCSRRNGRQPQLVEAPDNNASTPTTIMREQEHRQTARLPESSIERTVQCSKKRPDVMPVIGSPALTFQSASR